MKISQSLKKDEILRGFRAYEDVLETSNKLQKKYIIAYYRFTDNQEFFPVKVGFLISKKKLKKPS